MMTIVVVVIFDDDNDADGGDGGDQDDDWGLVGWLATLMWLFYTWCSHSQKINIMTMGANSGVDDVL